MSGAEAELAVRRIWKEEAPRVIGGLARLLRDVALAEDFAQEAVVAALEQWPRSGVPEKPGAWLMTIARNRALNALRRAVSRAPQPDRSGWGPGGRRFKSCLPDVRPAETMWCPSGPAGARTRRRSAEASCSP